MNRYLSFAALAMSLMSRALVPSLSAGVPDKKTTISISQPITVNGTTLPAGQYVLRLQDVRSGRDVVYIFNRQETRLIATVRAIHASRLDSNHKSDFSFYGSPAGQPPALRKWFYEGDNYGLEFLSPQHSVAAEPGEAGN